MPRVIKRFNYQLVQVLRKQITTLTQERDEWIARFNKLPEIVANAEERGQLAILPSEAPALPPQPERTPRQKLSDVMEDLWPFQWAMDKSQREEFRTLLREVENLTAALPPAPQPETELTIAKGALAAADAEIAHYKAEVDATWKAIERGWVIEPRSQFEVEALTNGFQYPLVQAIHHLWKRELKERPEPSAPAPAPQREEEQEDDAD